MNKFAAFTQVLENPFLALKFRQNAQERQAILNDHGFSAEEAQAVCAGVTADDENQVAELFGHSPGKYMLIVVVVDSMSAAEKSTVLTK